MKSTMFLGAAFGAVALTAGMVGPAAAADGATLYVQKTCIACHGPEGRKPIMPNYPAVAGQQKEYIIQQMTDIKTGARDNGETAAMKGVMHLVNEEEIAVIAEYLSGLER